MTPASEQLPASPPIDEVRKSTVDGVSVILPVLNEELYLAHTAEAILSQDYLGQIEIILALGPSVDQTENCARTKSQRPASNSG